MMKITFGKTTKYKKHENNHERAGIWWARQNRTKRNPCA